MLSGIHKSTDLCGRKHTTHTYLEVFTFVPNSFSSTKSITCKNQSMFACILFSIYLQSVPVSLLAGGSLCIPVLDSTWKGKHIT